MAFAGFSPGRGRGAAAGDEPQALGGGDRGLPRALRRAARRRTHGVDERAGRARLDDGRRASRASASPRPTAPPSACSPTSRPGCACTTARSSSARCSTSSRWASTRPTRSSTRPSGAGIEVLRARRQRQRGRLHGRRRTPGRARRGAHRARLRARACAADEVAALVAAREAAGPFRIARATSRSRAGAGARRARAARLVGRVRRAGRRRPRRAGAGRRRWRAAGRRRGAARAGGRHASGGAAPRAARGQGTQLALPLELPAAPRAAARSTGWEAMIADYATTGLTIGDAPAAACCARSCGAGAWSPAPTSSALPHGTRGARRRAGRRAPAAGHRQGRRASCCSRTSSARST